MATQKNVSNVANQESRTANTPTLPPSTVPSVSAPLGTILLPTPTMPVSVVVTTPTLAHPLCSLNQSQRVAPKRKGGVAPTYVWVGSTASKLAKVDAVSASSMADSTLARQHYFNGITFHVLKSPRNNLDQIFGPKHEDFIKAHGGEVIQQQEQVLPNTIVVASKDDSYNLEKIHELKQHGIIVYAEALSLVLSDHWLDGGSQFEMSRFFDYVQFAIVTCNFPISQSALDVGQCDLKTEQTEVTPPQSTVGTETRRWETFPIAKAEASVERVDDATRSEPQIGMKLKTCKQEEECREKLPELKKNKICSKKRMQRALAFKLALRNPKSQRELGRQVANCYNSQKTLSEDALTECAGKHVVQRLLKELDHSFEDLRDEFTLTKEMYDCLKKNSVRERRCP